MKRLALILAISSLGLCVPAFADGISLNDWCFNVNGDAPNGTCNLSGTPNPAVNLSGFDSATNIQDGNMLGTAVITLGAGSNQSVGFYADYDINQASWGSYNDAAGTTGTLASGQSYSINDPNLYTGPGPTGYTLLDSFVANTLDNTNNSGTPGHDPQCCDIAFAMSFGDINLGVGGAATVSFTVSTTAPGSGFYITQTGNDGGVLYLSGNVDVTNPGGPGTPEPSTFLLGGGALALVGFVARRKRARSSQV